MDAVDAYFGKARLHYRIPVNNHKPVLVKARIEKLILDEVLPEGRLTQYDTYIHYKPYGYSV